jgi:hypothetical protein
MEPLVGMVVALSTAQLILTLRCSNIKVAQQFCRKTSLPRNSYLMIKGKVSLSVKKKIISVVVPNPNQSSLQLLWPLIKNPKR